MDISLPKPVEQKLTTSVRRYLAEAFGEDVGDLKASLFLKFCLEEIAPSVYNQAFAHEQGYWTQGGGKGGVARRPELKR